MTRSRRGPAAALVVALAGALCLVGACNRHVSLTACTVLRRAELERALHAHLQAPRPIVQSGDDTQAGRSFCLWLRPNEQPPDGTYVALVQDRAMAGAVRRTGFSASAVFTSAREKAEGTVDDVDGLGTDAFWTDGRLHVLIKGAYLSLAANPAVPRADVEGLARPAVSRLAG